MHTAIAREKQIKNWRRAKKELLAQAQNPGWRDLSEGWFERHRFQPETAQPVKQKRKIPRLATQSVARSE
jgi:hypothetical protein